MKLITTSFAAALIGFVSAQQQQASWASSCNGSGTCAPESPGSCNTGLMCVPLNNTQGSVQGCCWPPVVPPIAVAAAFVPLSY